MNAANSILCLQAETRRVESITGYVQPKPTGPHGTFISATSVACRQTIRHKAVAAWRAGKDIPARAIMPAAGVDVLVESSLLVPLAVRS